LKEGPRGGTGEVHRGAGTEKAGEPRFRGKLSILLSVKTSPLKGGAGVKSERTVEKGLKRRAREGEGGGSGEENGKKTSHNIWQGLRSHTENDTVFKRGTKEALGATKKGRGRRKNGDVRSELMEISGGKGKSVFGGYCESRHGETNGPSKETHAKVGALDRERGRTRVR